MICLKTKKSLVIAGMSIVMLTVLSLAYCSFHGNKTGPKKHSACGVVLPKASGWVNDYVSLYLPAQRFTLDSSIALHEQQFSNEIAVVTIDEAMLGRCTLEEYTLNLARAWGVGKKIKNNGILIGIVPALRKIRIENGYGIEKILTNNETKQIIDSVMVPHFKNGHFFEGTRQGLFAIFKKLAKRNSS